ncbi:DUF5698 domain-containing protein [Deltaproteobacteria bacterium OttesenSCG-928-K17]|nr:DUF5698 domain-containing protein [Deltaproteobacteria bacterium OttesenSCG-928-K17]
MGEFFETYSWALPLVIFCGRIIDVSLGTLRIVFVSRGARHIAPVVGFVEIFIWIVVIAQVFAHADGFVSYFAYAAGYAAGTFVGLTLENKIGFGYAIVRVFSKIAAAGLIADLNHSGFGATMIKGEGAMVKINIIESVVRRVDIKNVEKIMEKHDPAAFMTIEDVRTRHKGIFAKYF